MLTGFYTNVGMGAKNLVQIRPPSIGCEDIATYLCFDRIYVDGATLDWVTYEGGEGDKWYFRALTEHGLIEPKRGYYAEADIWEAQRLFVSIYRTLEPTHKNFPPSIRAA